MDDQTSQKTPEKVYKRRLEYNLSPPFSPPPSPEEMKKFPLFGFLLKVGNVRMSAKNKNWYEIQLQTEEAVVTRIKLRWRLRGPRRTNL